MALCRITICIPQVRADPLTVAHVAASEAGHTFCPIVALYRRYIFWVDRNIQICGNALLIPPRCFSFDPWLRREPSIQTCTVLDGTLTVLGEFLTGWLLC